MAQTILVIDDSSTIRQIVKVYLSLMGRAFEFVEAEGGERGLQLARLVPVDLVIADINMPGMDGLTFVRQIRADERPNVRSLPVIMLTGDKSEDLKKQAKDAGANAFVQKPVSSASLADVINKLLPQKG